MAARAKKTTRAATPKTAVKIVKTKPSLAYKVGKFYVKNRKKLYLVVIFAVVLGGLYLARGLFIAATVNGKPITRFALIKTLEKKGGKDMLDELIAKSLIKGEFKKNNISITDGEINSTIDEFTKNVEAQGGTLESYLTMQGMTRDQLIESITIQKSLEKLFAEDIKVTDEEAKASFEENKTLYGESATYEGSREQVVKQLSQQKLSDKFYPWLTDLKSNAKIMYFINL